MFYVYTESGITLEIIYMMGMFTWLPTVHRVRRTLSRPIQIFHKTYIYVFLANYWSSQSISISEEALRKHI